MQCTTIGIDIAKSVFQLSVANQHGKIVERHRLTRGQFDRYLYKQAQSKLVMEACGTAHHWARVASSVGHEVMLVHPAYVKPYVRRNKTGLPGPSKRPITCLSSTRFNDCAGWVRILFWPGATGST